MGRTGNWKRGGNERQGPEEVRKLKGCRMYRNQWEGVRKRKRGEGQVYSQPVYHLSFPAVVFAENSEYFFYNRSCSRTRQRVKRKKKTLEIL